MRWIRWTYHGRQKGHKKCLIKRKFKFQDYKNCLEATPIENKTNHFAQNKFDVDSLKEDQKKIIKIDKLILKTQQRLRSEKDNMFTEKSN